ncbi:MAG: DUF4347 domain-containing protein [Rhizobiales bacterium]|nr:DUF4347 domain-containing protein [Hyphomicrobiales bacterium]
MRNKQRRSVLSRLGKGTVASTDATSDPRLEALRTLEARMVFDAAIAATTAAAADQHHDGAPDASLERLADHLAAAPVLPDASALAAPDTAGRHEIIFVDSTVSNWTEITASAAPGAEIVILDANRDGVEQIAAALTGRTNIDAIHIVSHGDEGSLRLGSATLDAASMQGAHLDELTAIGRALSADGDILIYGCDFTAGDKGLEAAMIMGGVTGADIAASNDLTGAANLGGDWTLETTTGHIESSALAASDWRDVLTQTTINPAGGVNATGSDGLRIYVTNLGQVQVRYQNANQFYSNTLTDTSPDLYNGVYLAVGNTVVTPVDFATASDPTDFPGITDAVFKSSGPQTLTGAGTAANPYVVTTTMYYDANNNNVYNAATDYQVQIQTSYVLPNKYYTQTVTVTPPPTNTQTLKLYHVMDTFLAGGDAGPAFSLDPSLAQTNNTTGDPNFVGVRKGVGTATESLVGFAEIEGGSQFDHYYSGTYNGANLYGSGLNNGGDIINTWMTAPTTDNGLGVQFTLGAVTGATSVSYHVAFDGDTKLDLDANDSTTTGTSYNGTFQAATGASVPIVDSDITITNAIGDIADATVTLTNPQSGDVLTVNTALLPSGVTVEAHSAYSVTLTGVANEAAYQAAIQAIQFSSSSAVTGARTFSIAVHNQLNSVTTTATSTLTGAYTPTVDLNSGLASVTDTNNIIVNGGFSDFADLPFGWTESGTGATTDSAITGRYGFTATAADTLTKTGLTGVNVGPAPSGAGRLTLDIGWVNGSATASRTFNIQIGGVTYATLTTGVGATANGTITYLNGATNAAGTTTATTIGPMASASAAMTAITINLPASVAAAGNLAFVASNAADDIYIDNVRLLTNVTAFTDAQAGNDFSAAYVQNSTAVSIADTDADVRDGNSANMASGVVTITNAVAGDRLLVAGSAAASGTINGISYTNTGSVVTLTGSATKANYASAIRAIAFEHTTGDPQTGVVRDITALVNDGTTNSNIAHSYITVTDPPPVLDLNSGANNVELITNGDSPGGAGWTVVGTGSAANGGWAWISDGATGTLTQTGVTGWATGNAPNGAAQLTFNAGWNNAIPESAAAATLSVSIGGVTYATISTSTTGGSTATVTYLNGASGSPATITSSTFGSWTPTAITINLPANVANSGSLVFAYASGGGGDDIWIDAVSANTVVDATAGVNFATSYTENGAPVSIADTDSTVRDANDANMESGTVTLTNPQTGDRLLVNGSSAASGSIGSISWTRTDSLVTFTGTATKAQYAAAFQLVTFENTTDTPSTTTRVINSTVNDGTSNSGTAVTTITVTAVDDAPVNTLPATFTTNEDVSLQLTGLSVADPDAGTGSITVTLGVNSGTLAATSGGSVTVGGSGTGTLTLTGTLANINAYLASASAPTFSPVANANGAVTLTMTTNDGGNTGSGGPLTDVDTSTITVVAVNDTPTVTAPATLSVAEDGSLTVTGITFADVDASTGSMRITLTVPAGSGVLNWTTTAFIGATGSGTNTLVLTGQLAALNNAIVAGKLAFAPAANYTGSLTLSTTINDQGNTGLDPGLTGNATSEESTANTTITVTSVNDAPAGADKTITTNEDTAYTFTSADFGFTDPNDAPANAFQSVTITTLPTGGTLRLGGVAVTVGQVIPVGSIGTLTWTPAANANGTGIASFTFQVTDDGGTANGGQNTDQSANTITFNVTAVNDAPVNTLPATFATLEDTSLKLAGLSISDVDAASGTMTVTLSVSSGALTAASGGSVTVGGSGTGTLTLTGTLANINAYLAAAASQPSFAPATNANGAVTLTMTTNDGGNTGSGGPLTDVDTSTITVTSLNDAPAGADKTITTNEDTAYTFTSADFGFTDPNDTPANAFQSVTITTLPTGGTLRLGGVAVTVGQVIPVGSIGTLTWTPAANANGTGIASFTFQVTDDGGTANGGLNTDQSANTITFNVTAVNDAPVNTLPATFATLEDTSLKLAGLSISDVDAASGTMTVTLSVSSGALTAASGGSVTVGGSGTGTLTLTGTLANINAYLAAAASQPSFAPATNANGAVTLTMTTNDGGNTGSGGPLTDVDTSTITVTPVNDAPAGADKTITTNEDTAYTFTSADFGFTDPNDAPANAFQSVTITTLPTGGTLRLGGVAVTVGQVIPVGSIGTLTWTPAANANGTGIASFTFQVTDDGGTANGGLNTDQSANTITFNVTPVNDAPVSTALANQTGADASSVNLDVSGAFSDPDATDALAFSASGLPAGLSIDPVTGVISGTIDHSASASGPYSVTVTATDPWGATTSQTFTWTVTNPAPAAQDDAFAASENTVASGNVLVDNGSGADADPDGDALTVSAVNGVAGNVGSAVAGGNGGSFTIGADGTLSFDPGADFNDLAVGETRTTSVTYTISDGEGGTSTATATVTVTGVNDAPTSTALANQSGADASSVNLDVSGAFSDPDATDALAFSASGLPGGAEHRPGHGRDLGDDRSLGERERSVQRDGDGDRSVGRDDVADVHVDGDQPGACGRRTTPSRRARTRSRAACARRQRVRRGRRSRRRRADGVGGERRRRQCRFGGGGRQWRLVHDRRGWNAELRSGRGLQ